MPKHDRTPDNANHKLLDALYKEQQDSYEEDTPLANAIKHIQGESSEDSKVVNMDKPHKPKETPIWKQYGFQDEESFLKRYPNYGKSPKKKGSRGVN